MPDGKFAPPPTASDPVNTQAVGDAESGYQGIPLDLEASLKGWNYETDTGNVPLTDASPSSLTLTPLVLAPPPPLTPSPPTSTSIQTFNPWQYDAATGLGHPAAGLVLTQVTGSCDSGSADDHGRFAAFRCNANNGDVVGNGVPCFADTASGDPGSPLLCSADPTSNQVTELSQQVGSQLPLGLANKEDLAAPPWVIVLADGKTCHYHGYGTNFSNLLYFCRNGYATIPDRAGPVWTVQEGTGQAPITPSAPRIAVVTAYR